MTRHHHRLTLVLLLLILGVAAWRHRPHVPPDIAPPCRHMVLVEVAGRPLALCLAGPAAPLAGVLARVGQEDCEGVQGEVRAGTYLRLPAGRGCLIKEAPMPASTRLTMGLRLDLNRASAKELLALPRIGPALASRIVKDRERLGSFRSVDGLDRVRGIGPGIIRRLRDLVSAGELLGGGGGGQ